jgi:transposase
LLPVYLSGVFRIYSSSRAENPNFFKDSMVSNFFSIGEIVRFDHAKKLVAFVGVDPSIFSSGKFVATQNKITKHGSRRLRTALYQAVRCGIRSNRNKKLRAYYDKKRAEGKLFKVAIIACVNKLIHWIFAILTTKEAFRLE